VSKDDPSLSRQKSQIFGIVLLAALVLLIACLRYYLKLG
jgi:hypothetical protein